MISRYRSDTSTIQSRQNNAPSKVRLIIHNRFSGIELVSPVYGSGNGAKCHLSPDQRVNVGSTTQAGFKIDLTRAAPTNILMYELRNTRPNEDAISSGDEARCIQLFIIWRVGSLKQFRVFSDLIEHDKGLIWNRGELTELVNYFNLYDIHIPIEKTCLLRDNTVLMTRGNVTREGECYKLEMTISEGSINEYTRVLWYYDVDKWY
jgi:hypothetical protein